MDYNEYIDKKELEEYRQYMLRSISERDMRLDNMIEHDMYIISNEVGGQQGMYDNFPINRVYRDGGIVRVYHLTSVGGLAIIQDEHYQKIVTLGGDDGHHFLNSADIYCSNYGTKLDFVYALSEVLSLFNNIK